MQTRIVLVAILTSLVAMNAQAGKRVHANHKHAEHKQAEAPVAAPAAETPPPAAVVEPTPPPPAPVVVEDEEHFSAGLELYFLEPKFSSNPAFVAHINDGVTDLHTQTEFNFDNELTPAIWIGHGNKDGGWRLRYFGFHEDADRLSATDATGGVGAANVAIQTAGPGGLGFDSRGTTAAPTILNFFAALNLDTIDLEATWVKEEERTKWTITRGLRYGEIKQRYTANEVVAATGLVTTELRSVSEFEGFGPTMSVEGKRKIGDNGLSFFGFGRGSLLYGDREQAVGLGVTPPVGTTAAAFTQRYDSDGFVPMLDLEGGLEWRGDFAGHSSFAQIGLASQTWFNVGNSSGSEDLSVAGSVAPANNRIVGYDVVDRTSALSLVGLKLAAGMKF